jgi:hypothetical protein
MTTGSPDESDRRFSDGFKHGVQVADIQRVRPPGVTTMACGRPATHTVSGPFGHLEHHRSQRRVGPAGQRGHPHAHACWPASAAATGPAAPATPARPPQPTRQTGRPGPRRRYHQWPAPAAARHRWSGSSPSAGCGLGPTSMVRNTGPPTNRRRCRSRPVGFQNSATAADQRFQAADSYWLIKPPRIGRRRILPWTGSGTGASGRGGHSCSARSCSAR